MMKRRLDQRFPARSPSSLARKLRCEPLEDRRMLSVLFVDDDAAAGGDGLAWNSAYGDLQDALSQAAVLKADADPGNDVDQIWIAEGVYKPNAESEPGDPRSASFSLVDGVTLYGGFVGTEAAVEERDVSEHVTTLCGDIGVAGDASDNVYTVVYCGEGVDGGVDGVSVTGGNANGESRAGHPERTGGGGFYNLGTLTIVDGTIWGNMARGAGGGICNREGTLMVAGSKLLDNATDRYGSGGGISNYQGELTVANTTISGNSAEDGGGVCNSYGTLTITGSTFSDNEANGRYGEGGGICVAESSVTVANSTFSGNKANSQGGAIFNGTSGALTILDSRFLGNSAGHNGGAIQNDSMLRVVNSTFVGNSAEYDGGAIRSYLMVAITNCTLTHNSAGYSGGGILVGRGGLELHNSILWQNRGGDLKNAEPQFVSPSSSASGNLVGIDPRFVRDPSDGGDGWGDDSGTPDVDESANDDYGDLRLTSESPAVALGDNSAAVDEEGNPLATDLAGQSRIYGVSVDCGAYELQDAPAAGRETPSLTVNTSEDVVDLYDGRISLREAIFYAGADSPDATITFDEALDAATIALDGTSLRIEKPLVIDASPLTSLTIDAGRQSCVFTVVASREETVELNGLTITGGWATRGGGIYSTATLRVTNGVIAGNASYSGGGGIYNDGGTLTVANVAISGNATTTGLGRGGGIYNEGMLTVTNATIAGNASDGESGGIFNDGTLVLHNSILWQNGDGELEPGRDSSIRSSLIGIDPRFIRDPSDGGDGWGDDPETPSVDESANDDYGDLRLTSRSPAIGYGDNETAVDAAGNPIATDLDGNNRIYGESVDCGAFEFQDAAAPGSEDASLTVNTSQDVFDPYDGRISLREAIYYAGHDGLGATIAFDGTLDGATVTLAGTSLWIDKPLTIDASPLTSLTVDADGRSRVFSVVGDEEDPVVLNNLTVTGGSALRGGGIFNNGTLTVVGATLSDNSADSGGGILNARGMLTVINSVLCGNSASSGGGIYNNQGTVDAANVTLAGNAADFGGGIYNKGVRTITGIYGGPLTLNAALGIVAVEITGPALNTTSSIDLTGIVTLNNSIVAVNNAQQGPDIYNREFGGRIAGSHSLIGDGTEQTGLVNGENGNLVGMDESPIDPRFLRTPSDGGDGWGDNPYTPEIDESANDDHGNLRLRAGSPAIDQGDSGLLPEDTLDLDRDGNRAEPVPLDLGGNARVVGGAVDMGAYEYFALPGIPGDLNNDCSVNSSDLDIIRANWGRTVTPGSLPGGDPSGDGLVNLVDLNLVRANWGTTTPMGAGVRAATGASVHSKAVSGPRTASDATDTALRNWDQAELAWAKAIEAIATRQRRDVRTATRAAAVDLVLFGWE